jgi:serine/threonine-protein kinase ATR
VSQKSIKSRIPQLVDDCINMTNGLLALCDHPVTEGHKRLSMHKDFPKLDAMASSALIIPLQGSLTASLPPTSSTASSHQPFPLNSPRFQGEHGTTRPFPPCNRSYASAEFGDEIEIMRSLAKPRKIFIVGSDGQTYIFLGKPKDDLRKDARLMDFNSIINNLLKKKSESRRRKLRA